MNKIKLGILGGGGDSLIGPLHRIAAQMFDDFDLLGGVFNPDLQISLDFANEIGLPSRRIYQDIDAFIVGEKALPENERIEAVSILTPNFLHFPMAKKLIENGFHVICEKPLTTTFEEAKILENAIKKNPVVFAVTYTYTGYPLIRQIKQMIKEGYLGNIQKTDIQYYQGWINPIIHDPQKRKATWRLDPEKSGLSCCLGDIGTHAFQMTEYLTDIKVASVLADLNYLYRDNTMDVDATILLQFENSCKGILRVSQIATGEENNLSVAIYGDKASIKWNQETPNEFAILHEISPKQIYTKGQSYNNAISNETVKLPPGHPEGIFDAMGGIYKGVAKAIRNMEYDPMEFPTLKEGIRGMKFIESCLKSQSQKNIWMPL